MMYRYLRKIRSEWLQLIISLVLKPYIVFSGCRTQTPDRIRIIFLFRCRQEFFQNVILARGKNCVRLILHMSTKLILWNVFETCHFYFRDDKHSRKPHTIVFYHKCHLANSTHRERLTPCRLWKQFWRTIPCLTLVITQHEQYAHLSKQAVRSYKVS